MRSRGAVRTVCATSFLLVSLAWPVAGFCQAGISLEIDMSPTAAGMGRAGAAQWWGEATNDWINPALLATTHGIRYDHWHTHLVPGLAANVVMDADRWRFGAAGIGVLVSGRGLGAPGGARLDYGNNQATDENGNVIGTFNSFETIDSWGVAVSAAGLLDATLPRERGVRGRPRRLGDYLDAGAGFSTHRLYVDLVPASLLPPDGARGRSHAEDWGVYARFTPYNSVDGRSRLRELDHFARHYFGGVRVDASFGHSVKGANDSDLALLPRSAAEPLPRSDNTGWALHAATGFPRMAHGDAQRWLARTFTPLLAWGFVSDHRVERRGAHIDSHGWELQLAHVWTIRNGYYKDPAGTIVDPTRGWSLAVPLAGLGEVRFDHAKVPQSKYLTDHHEVTRSGVSVILHPGRAWRWLR